MQPQLLLLTGREQEVLELLSQGHSNPRIAALLCITTNTVEQHLKHVYKKLAVTNRVEASRIYIEQIQK